LLNALSVLLRPDPSGAGQEDDQDDEDDEDDQSTKHLPPRRHRWPSTGTAAMPGSPGRRITHSLIAAAPSPGRGLALPGRSSGGITTSKSRGEPACASAPADAPEGSPWDFIS